MPLTPFAQSNYGNSAGGGQAGFDPLTGRPNQQKGFQMPPPLQTGMSQLGGPFLSQQGQQSLAGGQMPSNEEQQGFEMPPPPGGPMTYQSPLGQTYQLDPNAAYTVGMGGKPKRAQMI